MMMGVDERKGVARPDLVPMGLVWLKGTQQGDFSRMERALSVAARIHMGPSAPVGERPASAVIFCPTGEDDLAAEVSSIRIVAPDATVLVFALAPDLQLARAALRAGARGLIHSGMPSEQVVRAIWIGIKGEIVLPRELLRQWIDEQRPPDLRGLSPRQREILELVTQGATNRKIARRLYLSKSTVKYHLRTAYKVLGVKNRREAVGLLRRNGGV